MYLKLFMYSMERLRDHLRDIIRDTERHTEESVCKRLYHLEQQFLREMTAQKSQAEELRKQLNDAIREKSSLQHCVITYSLLNFVCVDKNKVR